MQGTVLHGTRDVRFEEVSSDHLRRNSLSFARSPKTSVTEAACVQPGTCTSPAWHTRLGVNVGAPSGPACRAPDVERRRIAAQVVRAIAAFRFD